MEQNTCDENVQNAGWADVFSKVLTANPKLRNKKHGVPILVKAKKDNEITIRKKKLNKNKVPAAKKEPLKIVDGEGNVVSEDEAESSSQSEDEPMSDGEQPPLSAKEFALRLKLKKEMLQKYVVAPVPNDPKEKELLKVATRGVVQLFNAVTKHQKDKAKILDSDDEDTTHDKGKFMDTLRAVSGKKQKTSEDNPGQWDALRDDFMMGSGMKDWDKESDSD